MSIRLKHYKFRAGGTRHFRAIRITEKNLTQIVEYINRHGGAATGHNGDTRSGRPARIRIKQRNYGQTWGKLDWRVAKVGDFIVRHDFDEELEKAGYDRVEFMRIKEDEFEITAVEVK